VRIGIASDHGGFRLKSDLLGMLRDRAGLEIEDLGTHSEASTDYPDYAHRLATLILQGELDRGILVCGTGIGMSIAANRHAGIRCVVCSDTYTAKLSREHNDTNILALGERVVGKGLARRARRRKGPGVGHRHGLARRRHRHGCTSCPPA